MEAPGAEFGVRAKPSWLVAGRWSRACCPLPGSRSWRRTRYGTNEELPGDIVVLEGGRLLVLDEPMYQRSWYADRFFPLLPGTAEPTCVLSADEARTWFARTPFGNGTCRAS
ncbi:hypothetical protein [Streptomyces sp. NPDC007856]|uniref:hypothetical protein n=1 Tax=Streptomyces sp. NPDC007856 TaxID=3364781 RepID=UPI0036763951